MLKFLVSASVSLVIAQGASTSSSSEDVHVPSTKAGNNPIKHLIILMMENRSFDHYLGWLKEFNNEINGLTGNEFNCVNVSTNETCVTVNKHGYDVGPDDPKHDFDSVTQQIYGFSKSVSSTATPHNNGFVWNANLNGNNITNPMSMFTINSTSANVLNKLALNYALFDEWYCSIPSSTDPNRGFGMSGTSNGMVVNYNGTLWSQESYFEFLRKHNVSWNAYYDNDLWAIAYFQDMNKLPNSANMKPISQFYDDLNDDNLASFIWLQPSMTTSTTYGPPNWQHPDASVKLGEELIATVYQSLKESQYWNESALLITFDEHGGFFDHATPPQDGVPPPDGVKASNGFTFDRLGPRIPSVLVSPWVNKGTVIHKPTFGVNAPNETSQWESTSNLATANNLFGIDTQLYSLGNRMKWAATYDYLFLQRNEARGNDDTPDFSDFVKTFPLWTLEDVTMQAKKPLNDHLEIQVNFYCKQMKLKKCPKFDNQGEASQFIMDMAKKYIKIIQNRYEIPK